MPRRNNENEQPNCCRCCTGFLFSSGLTALLLWLTLKSSSPKYSIESFYVPVLNKNSTSVNSTTISFDLRLKNENRNKGIYYDALDLTFFYYFPENSSFSEIGNITIPEFYQGHLKTAHRVESIRSYGVSLKDVKMKAPNGSSTTMFRVDLDTEVRYKIMLSRTKRHRMRLGVNVTVNDEGAKSVDRGLRFSSAASHFNGLTTLVRNFLALLILYFGIISV
ncbi:hypothetical protein MKW98_018002 [Papaver atlanticum]|uniref:Late embryogenesis abundant protein LEA-2 subgroup domain-containing protein n=1 Tax=Papaver atlanticum TaxID=357466 RepID=A0AAD4TCC0_9MAGN|nr:hypothetical protein MKW98_018002 [Papaver atlanticum]